MKFEIKELKQEGSLFNKHFPKCMICGKEIPEGKGVEVKTGAIGVGCGCMSLVSFALVKKDAETFAKIEFSEEEYERINYKISARCKELAEEALNNCLVVSARLGDTVINSIVLDDKFSDAYDLAKGLLESGSAEESAIYYQAALDKNIPIAIVQTIEAVLVVAEEAECSFGTFSKEDAIKKFAKCTLGWRIYPHKSSGFAFYYNEDFLYDHGFCTGIDYSKVPEMPKDIETFQIHEYQCFIDVKISMIEYAVLFHALNEISGIEDDEIGKQRKALIVEKLYNEKHINPRLLDTLACVAAGLLEAECDDVTRDVVEAMLCVLFGWDID